MLDTKQIPKIHHADLETTESADSIASTVGCGQGMP
jgi:hypothetical protein